MEDTRFCPSCQGVLAAVGEIKLCGHCYRWFSCSRCTDSVAGGKASVARAWLLDEDGLKSPREVMDWLVRRPDTPHLSELMPEQLAAAPA